MKVEINYPKTNSRRRIVYKMRKYSAMVLAGGVVASGIVNLAVGGSPWFFYVLGGAVVFWLFFMRWSILDNSIMQKMFDTYIGSAFYLVVVDLLLEDISFAVFVVPIVSFGFLLLMNVTYYIELAKNRNNVIPLILMNMVSVAVVIFCGVWNEALTWEVITLLAMVVVGAGFGFLPFRKQMFFEVKKRFHT